jgi:hypothetical protein
VEGARRESRYGPVASAGRWSMGDVNWCFGWRGRSTSASVWQWQSRQRRGAAMEQRRSRREDGYEHAQSVHRLGLSIGRRRELCVERQIKRESALGGRASMPGLFMRDALALALTTSPRSGVWRRGVGPARGYVTQRPACLLAYHRLSACPSPLSLSVPPTIVAAPAR